MDGSGRSSSTVAETRAAFRRLIADQTHGPLPALMLLLTVLTGVVDAVSILSLGRVFVANMTGNVVFIGFALAGASGFSLAASLSALGGFLVGAAIGGARSTVSARIEVASYSPSPARNSSCSSPRSLPPPSPAPISAEPRKTASPPS